MKKSENTWDWLFLLSVKSWHYGIKSDKAADK